MRVYGCTCSCNGRVCWKLSSLLWSVIVQYAKCAYRTWSPVQVQVRWNGADFDVQIRIRSGHGPGGVCQHIVGVTLASIDIVHACWYSSRVYSLPIQVQCFSRNFGLQQHERLWASRVVSETIRFYSNDGLGERLRTSKATMDFWS